MDTRAFSMARSLRISASAVALVLCAVTGPSHAQDRVEGQRAIPFTSLSVSAQQEILLQQRGLRESGGSASDSIAVAEPVARDFGLQPNAAPIFADDRKLRIGWAIGVYR